jgi:hypothetical protein
MLPKIGTDSPLGGRPRAEEFDRYYPYLLLCSEQRTSLKLELRTRRGATAPQKEDFWINRMQQDLPFILADTILLAVQGWCRKL